MKQIYKLFFIFNFCLCSSFFSSCYYDNLSGLNPTMVELCDTLGTITYTKNIVPIMNNYCVSCHSGSAPSAGISLDNYSSVKNSAVSGKLYGAVIWDGSTSPMPKGASNKINDCSINQIKKWIATGYSQ